MLNSIKSKTKKIIYSFILCLGILISAFTGKIATKPVLVEAKSTNKIVEDVTEDVFGTGHNFNASTTTSPVSPSGWNKISENSYNESKIIKGVVNIKDETTFDTSEDKCGTLKPEPYLNNDKYYKSLMINANKEAGQLGYRNNTTITLEEDSYYRISVLLLTQQLDEVVETDDEGNSKVVQEETDPRASIYLSNLIEDKNDPQYNETKFENFSTLGAWTEYYFYISTNEEANVNLELWLGSKSSSVQGAVFFNNVTILRYSEDKFDEVTSNLVDTNSDNFNIINLETTKTSPFTNSDFEDVSLNGWRELKQSTTNPTHQLHKSVNVNSFTNVNDNLTIEAPGTNCSSDNALALFMYNKKEGYQALESNPITINKQSYYKLSFWAKSDCNEGSGATVMLVDKTKENPTDSAKLTLATKYSNDSNKFRNNWTQYSFYIAGPAIESKEATVQIWLGTQDAKTTGYVFIDDFTIENIDYETYSNNSSNSNATAFNLNNGSDNYSVTNGNFDKIKSTDSVNTYPAVPSDWSTSENTSSFFKSGIINTIDSSYNLKALPNTNTLDNNVLMIGSTAENTTQTYTSNTLSFNSDSYYSISFYVSTNYFRNIDNKNYGARVTIKSADYTLYDYYNIYYTNNDWHKVEFRFKTGTIALSPTINLTFENTTGSVYFDKVEMKTLDKNLYENKTLLDKSTEYHYIDLSKETFENRTFNKFITNKDKIDTPNNFTLSTDSVNTEFVNAGIINADNSLLEGINPSISDNTSYLYISSFGDTYYAYNSNQKYTFDSETYYKISVNVLTRYLDKETETDKEFDNFGASIKLTNSSEIMICAINTESKWKTYTIYASFKESLTSSITFALGYVNETLRGEVLFDNLQIEKITQDTYKEEISDIDLDTDSTVATFINYVEQEETEEEEDKEKWSSNFDWLLIPSILTALSIIIAIVGHYVKKIKFNKKPKVKTHYDRRKTLDKDIDRREKIALRQQIIEELNAEISSIDKEIEEFDILASQKLEELKEQIKAEQEELEKSKLELEIRKKEATKEREKKLKETPDFVSDKKAEKEYNNFISKLDKEEMSIQKKIASKELRLTSAKEQQSIKRARYLERQEYIRLQIAKIEAEIEEIAKQEAEIWAEYKAAKADAKRRKAEYEAQVKAKKEKKKTSKTNSDEKSTTSKKETNKTTKKPTKNNEPKEVEEKKETEEVDNNNN